MSQSSFSSLFSTKGWRPADLARDGGRAWQLLRDGRVPGWLKLLLPLGALVYWVVPVDLIPGIPLDDIAVVLIALRIFVMMGESAINKGSGTKGPGNDDPIDTTWQVIDK